MQREGTTGQQHANDNDDMHQRQITLADGRYMIFYTFGEAETQATTLSPLPTTKEEQNNV